MIQIFAVSILPLRETECFRRYYDKSCEMRRRKADNLKMQDDKARCIAAGLLLEYAYNRYINDSEKELAKANSFGHIKLLDALATAYPLPEIKTTEHGKPYFDGDVHFNLSHSGEYVLCAIGDAELGADVQKVTSVRENVVKNYFSVQEQEAMNGLSERDREKKFSSIWTQREATAKLSGRGIGEILEASRSRNEECNENTACNPACKPVVHHGYIGNDHAWAVAFYDKTQTIGLSVLPEGVFFK